MVCWLLWLSAVVLLGPSLSEVLWTPILPASQDQVDLWTVSGSGCSCSDTTEDSMNCACCVNRVACPCGVANPHRCAQCGLQQHCNNMCNMTIDGSLLSVTSGRVSGSLVPPGDMSPPLSCWYLLRAPPGHRVEVQLHRLVHVGSSFNDTTCRGGFVEVSDGRNPNVEVARGLEGGMAGGMGGGIGGGMGGGGGGSRGVNTMRICGEDQRLHPPAVLYSDSGMATIIYKVSEQRGSPRFIAYYNFPHKSNEVTGDLQRGGTQVEYTDCDWLYQDVHCMAPGHCHFTSPGYPGLYPPNSRCRYLMVMSSPATTGTIKFLAMDLPQERCATDYLAIYSGTSTSSPLITTICGDDARTIQFKGPNVLVDFSTGTFLPPYKFSGFHATVDFVDVLGNPQVPPPTPPPPPDSTHIMSDPTGGHSGSHGCHRVYWGNGTRQGNFDTSAFTPSHHCWLRYVGRQDDVIQVSLFKYKLGGKSCSSEVSIYDGIAGSESDNLLRKICGPVAREPRDSSGRFIQPEFLISSGNILEIHLNLGPHTDVEKQFLVGAYQFHNSRLEGTKNPNSVCDVMFYGADSPSRGTVQDPPTRLLWNVEGSLTCSYLFVPTSNQSLSIMVRDAGGSLTSASCTTICGEEGCQCRPSMLPLSQVDYLLFVQTKTQKIVACLCGDMQGMQGVTVSSSGGIDVTYHVAHFTWATPGFNFTLEYSFPPPTACGPSFYNSPKGELGPREYKVPNTEYLYVTCSWLITNQPGTDLLLSVIPPRQGSCNVWNLTVVGVSRESGQRVVGGVCGADPSKSFRIHQYHHEAASITLELRGRGSREWEVSWNTILPDTHYGDAPTSVSPKPEHSRTLHAEPTGRKTYTVKSQGVSSHRPRWREWRHCGLPLLLTLVLSQTLCF